MQVNFLPLKFNVASKCEVNTFGSNIYFAVDGTYLCIPDLRGGI